MKNRLTTIALLGVIGLVLLGVYYKITFIIALTAAGLAVWGIVLSLEALVTQRTKIPMSDDLNPSYEQHTGPAALIYGVFGLLVSVPVLVVAMAFLVMGNIRAKAWFERLMHASMAPAAFAIAFGLGFMLYGLTRVLPGNDAPGGRLRRWSSAMMLFAVGGGIIVLAFLRSLP